MVDKKRKHNIESLQSGSTKFLCQQRLNNELNRNEFTDTEGMYNYLKNCINETAKKHWEKRGEKRKGNNFFWDAEIEKER